MKTKAKTKLKTIFKEIFRDVTVSKAMLNNEEVYVFTEKQFEDMLIAIRKYFERTHLLLVEEIIK